MATMGTERQFPLVCGDIEAAAYEAGAFFWWCTWNTIYDRLVHRSESFSSAFGKRCSMGL